MLPVRLLCVAGLVAACQPSEVVGYGEFDSESPGPSVYERLELVFENEAITKDRFLTYAHVTFRQGVESFTVDGYYDGTDRSGNHVWRARFMPNRPGVWHYKWDLGEQHAEGDIPVRERRHPNNHGHVHIDTTTPSVLWYDDGSTHYFFGGKWFSAKNYGPPSKGGEENDRVEDGSEHDAYVSDAQFERYIDLMQKNGHNGTLLKIGLFPLEDDKISWDLAWIRRAERWVMAMQRRNIYCQINFFDPWSRTKGSWFDYSEDPTEHLIDAWHPGDEKAKENYIRYIVARFAGFSNVYWELVNRADFAGEQAGQDFVEQANGDSTSGGSRPGYLEWLRMYDPYDLPVGASDVPTARRMPDVDIEFPRVTNPPPRSDSRRAMLLNELVHACLDPDGKTAPAHLDRVIRDPRNRLCYRSSFWQAFVLGAFGTNEASWLDLRKPLNDAVLDVMHDQGQLHSIVDSLSTPVSQLVYDPGFVESGSGLVGTRAKLGKTYVSYFLHAREPELVRIRLPVGQYKYQWLYPGEEDPLRNQTGGLSTTEEVVDLPRPAFERDLVLIVEREGASQPIP